MIWCAEILSGGSGRAAFWELRVLPDSTLAVRCGQRSHQVSATDSKFPKILIAALPARPLNLRREIITSKETL